MNYFILLCGGVGKRMKIETPKQYLKYKNKYIFQYSLEQAINTKLFKKYIIVAENSYFSLIKEATKNYNNIQLVEAGKTRQESTYNGLKSIENVKEKDFVVIHDSARMFIKANDIKKFVEFAKQNESCIPYKYENNAVFDKKNKTYLKRDDILLLETPQVFKLSKILKAHEQAALDNFVNNFDDSAIYFKYIDTPKFLLNRQYNLKITTLQDINEIEAHL